MNAKELKALLLDGGLEKYSHLYSDVKHQTERMLAAIDEFVTSYGENREVNLFSVPGRSEIIGNHTDHNNGKVMAGAIDRDIIAVVSKNDDNVIRFRSEGYAQDSLKLSDVHSTANFKKFTSRALIAGMANAFEKAGHKIGGFDYYACTEVLKGSGLSSSAAFEVSIGNILNHLYNEGSVANTEIAKYAQYSENVYFGKPCGLMDQMACAVGGFVYIDFENNKDPYVESVDFSLSGAGYSLCIVNTGGNHANLNDDYASVPKEMKDVAAYFGKSVLREIDEAELVSSADIIRNQLGDRALLRAIHFLRENKRVDMAKRSLQDGDLEGFYSAILASGRSSFQYLQNVYTNINVKEQGLSLALALTDGFLADKKGAFRVHGGGFAGTIQAFVRNEDLDDYIALIDSVFGKGAAMPLNIRPIGATRLF